MELEAPKPILKGEMLIALGLKPGPVFTTIIAASDDAQDDGLIHNPDSAIGWATKYVTSNDHT